MFTRCRCCLGMGYKGRTDRGKWRLRTCPRCGGRGDDPRPETLPENKPPAQERPARKDHA